MRYIVLAVTLLVAVGCEENYYYGFNDGGAVEAGTDSEGDNMNMASMFTPESKIFGHATLDLQDAPAFQTVGPITPLWPFIRETPAMQGSQTVLDLATADGKPHVVTMSFGLTGQQPIPDPLAPIGEVVALINLGVGGIMVPVEIDVAQGFQWSASVNRVQVHVVYRALPNSTAVPIPRPQYTVGASVSSDVIAHGRQPQRTLGKSHQALPAVPALLPGGADYWRVPAFAKSFRVDAVPYNAQLRILVLPLATALPDTADYLLLAYPSVDLPVPGDAYYVFVWNVGQANIHSYRLVFDLAL